MSHLLLFPFSLFQKTGGWKICLSDPIYLSLTRRAIKCFVDAKGWLFKFYCISTFVAYLMPNPSSSSSLSSWSGYNISLILSRHFSLSFIAPGRSSGLHLVSSHSFCMYVRAGRPAFARPYVEVHRSISLMSSSLLLQQCPACLVHLIWIVVVMRGRWPYSWCLVGCCRQDLFNIARNILV